MKGLVVILCFLGLVSVHANCLPKNVSVQLSNTIEVLNKQSKQLESLKAVQVTDYIDLQNIFGSEYSKENQLKILNALKKNHLLAITRYSNLIGCLEKLKQEKKINELKFAISHLEKQKIEFLEFNLNLNNALSDKIASQNTLPDLKTELQVEKEQSTLLKKELENQVVLADKEALSDGTIERKELAFFQSLITKTKIDILDYSLDFINKLEEKIKSYEEISKRLDNILLSFSKNKSDKEPLEYLEEVDQVWLDVIQGNFKQIFSRDFDFKLPLLKELVKEPKESRNQEYYNEIKVFYESVKLVRQNTISEIADKKAQELKLQNSLLIQVNTIRSRIYEDITLRQKISSFLSLRFWNLTLREVKASPYRIVSFLYEKYLYVHEQLLNETQGHKQLFLDFFVFVCFVIGILFLNKLINYLVGFFDEMIRRNASLYYRFSLVKMVSSAWGKLKKDAEIYLWLIFLLFIEEASFFGDFHLILDFVVVFLWYKVIVSMLMLFLGIISKIDYKNYYEFKLKAQKTSISIGRIYLFYGLSMLLVHGAVGKVYFYTVINILCGLLLFYKVIQKSSEWNDELQKYLERNFSGLIVNKINNFLKILPSIFRPLFFLLAIVVLQLFNLFVAITANFEISKKISANLFKKQIESLEVDADQNSTIPNEYRDLFHLNSLEDDAGFICPNDVQLKKINDEIHEWLNEKSDEHSVVLYGDKGIGKTTLMKHILKTNENDDVKTIYLKMPAKILTKEALVQFLEKELGIKVDDQLVSYDNSLETKMIIGVDEAQNIFLSQTGGFEAYYELINLVNMPTKNIFWVFSFNKYSWIYLDRAFGRNLFFRNIFEIKGWNDQKIKELILSRHKSSEYKLSYDLLISATKSDEEVDRYTTVESKFFTLLWELSHGNPRAALYLWPTSLTRKRRGIFNVNIPKLALVDGISNSSDSLLFVLTCALKHENVNIDEIAQSTNLPIGIIRNAIKVAMERKYLYRDKNGRYMVEISTQNSIIKLLKMKNFIYGN